MNADIEQAKKITRRAYQAHLAGKLNIAIQMYQESIEQYPTAEAHTLLGWAYSMQNRYDDAISECLRAIDLDSTLGNPYNDIGAYMIELGQLDEAIVWLERAMSAPNYENRAAPYLNLAKVHRLRGEDARVLEVYRAAYATDPRNLKALDYYQTELARWN